MGVETEYGLTTATITGQPSTLTPEDAAQRLFRRVVEWGRSTNTFLTNGSRLYLDVGAHPEYASAECDSIVDLVAMDKAGDRIFQSMADEANEGLIAEGMPERIHLIKNNVDTSGNSYGCHENYLIRRRRDFRARVDSLVPFFISRQVLTGAGHIRNQPMGASFEISQRADQMWDAISSASTRSRPIVNTRDEPHGDIEKYRRMHVIVGDTNMSDVSTALKFATTEMLLVLLDDGVVLPKLKLVDPMRAIRDISHDIDLRESVELEDGRRLTALQIQREYAQAAHSHYESRGYMAEMDPTRRRLAALWLSAIDDLEAGDLDKLDTTLDWVVKRKLLDRYRTKSGVGWDDPRLRRLELAYHDISPTSGLYRTMTSQGLLDSLVTDEQIDHAVASPPATTRAALRGRFVKAASEARRDFMVDWMNLRLVEADGARSVILKDPFAAVDERVDALLEHV
ncbi:Pup--protein ligase [Flaviflexus equikiangi]|uniref:Pup--protein ligase n=1 Tax=Flaviflexus equikiangi TaxID=2758573 RepID=A0ABS2TFA4_9ACTO|nr:Pup--protein ligase [Flaviflexus equikiangi]MBM9433340.1 Pup--protein ligase [Flaviflexus equikiangi]